MSKSPDFRENLARLGGIRFAERLLQLHGGLRRHPFSDGSPSPTRVLADRRLIVYILASLLAAGLAVNVGFSMQERQAKQSEVNNSPAAIEMPAPDFSVPIASDIPPSFTDVISEYMAADPRTARLSFQQGIITPPVRLTVIMPEGVNVRPFPDSSDPDNRVLTGQPEPFYMVEKYGAQLGVTQHFMAIKGENAADLTIWAVRVREKGPEFIAVYHRGEWLTKFTVEDNTPTGRQIPGERLFGSIISSSGTITSSVAPEKK